MDEMIAAVRLNWRLWTIIQAELLDPHCPLPADLRSNVLNLSQFIDKQSVAFIGERDPEMITVLISINRELAGGLYMTPPQGEDAAAAQAPAVSAPLAAPAGHDRAAAPSLRIST